MARNETFIGVPPERVFRELADGFGFARWLVGTKEVRGVDREWPSAGSSLRATVGVGPVESSGRTTVAEATPPWRLALHADGGLFGAATVELRLRPEGRGTRLTLVEDPRNRLVNLNPLVHLLVRARNLASLQRLRALAEGDHG